MTTTHDTGSHVHVQGRPQPAQPRGPLPPGPPLPPPPPVRLLGPRRSMTAIAALVVACLGTALAAAALIVTLTRPAPATAPPPAAAPAPPTYSADQIATAKTTTCSAAKRAIDGVLVSNHRSNPAGAEDALGWANVANARVGLITAALWLPTQVAPATPQDLKDGVRGLSAAAGDALGASVTDSDASQSDYAAAVDRFNAAKREIEGVCT